MVKKVGCVRCGLALGPYPKGGVCTACLMVEALRNVANRDPETYERIREGLTK